MQAPNNSSKKHHSEVKVFQYTTLFIVSFPTDSLKKINYLCCFSPIGFLVIELELKGTMGII